MTLPTSGPLSLANIQTEFGGTNPIGMNEYYAGGGLVPAGTTGTYGAVPSSGALSVQNFYGTSNYIPVYVEDLFSTYVYAGDNSTARTITNGINLAANGGLVWEKPRNLVYSHSLFDTARGATKYVSSNATSAQQTQANSLTSFTTTGYTLSDSTAGNSSGYNYVSWTFRKQAKFFDVVTYTGNGVNGRLVPTNVAFGNSGIGAIMVKRLDAVSDWKVFHRSASVGAGGYNLILNSNVPRQSSNNDTGSVYWETDGFWLYDGSVSNVAVNASGGTYVAYIFAHNTAGGFGLTGTDNIISCGSFTNDASSFANVTLGFEPQWVMFKCIDSPGGQWVIHDNIRGMNLGGNDFRLFADSTSAEATGYNTIDATSTGFSTTYGNANTTYIYIAVRRGPMKIPTSGTSVFKPFTLTGNSTANTIITTGFVTDSIMSFNVNQDGPYSLGVGDRLRPDRSVLHTSNTDPERVEDGLSFVSNTGVIYSTPYTYGPWNFNAVSYVQYAFGRAPSFFDQVCYTGNSTAGRTVAHNLGTVPQMIIVKTRSITNYWTVYTATTGNNKDLFLNTTDAATVDDAWNNTTPTASVFTLGAGSLVNGNTNYIAYLFATCPGVSKVGSYTGTGALQTINCGFTSGARFIWIKRTDAAGHNWYVYDSARGISSGADPYFFSNVDAPQVTGTNYVDTDATGFKVTAAAPAGLNASGGTYIFLAIA